MSKDVVLKETIDKKEMLKWDPTRIVKDIGDEFVRTGKSIEDVSQALKETREVLEKMANVMDSIVTAMSITQVCLVEAGIEIGMVKVPKIQSIVPPKFKEVKVFGGAEQSLTNAGKSLLEVGSNLSALEKSIKEISKSEGSLDKMSTDVLDPLGVRLTKLGKTFGG